MSNNSIILSAAGLKNIVTNNQEKNDEFKFVFGEKEFQLNSIFAEFVSPIVSHLHHSDPTINEINFNKILNEKFHQQEHSKYNFLNDKSLGKIIHISQGNSITINDEKHSKEDTENSNEIRDLLFLSILLGNEELYSKLSKKIEKTKDDEIQELELYISISKIYRFISCTAIIDEFASKISSKDEDTLKKVPRSILYSIIKSASFKFDDADKLFDIINEVFSKSESNYNDDYDDDKYEESNYINFFYESAGISDLSLNKFNEILTKIDYRDLTGTLWQQICEYFTKIQKKEEEENAKEEEVMCKYDGNTDHRFQGIINYLCNNKSQNICDEGIISVTANGNDCNCSPKNAVDLMSDYYFRSNTGNSYDSWLKYDFKDMKIRPTHYSVKTRSDSVSQNPQSWCIEVSNSGKDDDWRIIDSRTNVTSVSQPNRSDTFEISTKLDSNESYRYIRFRQTGPTSNNCYDLVISSLEYFGCLVKN